MLTQPAHAIGAAAARYAYVLDDAADAIDMFSINLSTGVLTHLIACAANPMPLAGLGIGAPSSGRVDPTGSFLYISDVMNHQVAGFAIQPNGCLALIPPILPTAGVTPSHLGISSSGEYLYVADTCGGPPQGCVEGFIINPNGTLVPVAGGPVLAGANEGGLAVDPVRQYIFASDDAAAGTINSSTFNPNGGVINLPWAPNATVRPNPFRMALDPVGGGLGAGGNADQFLFVVSNGAANLDCYTVNTGNGAVAWAGTAATGLNPFAVAVTPLGQFAYVTNTGGNSVQTYNINNCAGLAVDGAAVALPAGSNPEGITVDQTGRFVYVAASGTNFVYGYKVNLVNGTLAKIGNWATGADPIHIATQP